MIGKFDDSMFVGTAVGLEIFGNNMNGYLRTNGFDRIFAQEDYPKDKVVNSFGVQDDFLYQYALPILTETADEGQPFFAVLLSISNHPPYVIPKDFKTHSSTGRLLNRETG